MAAIPFRRAEKESEELLIWLFCNSSADLGIRSNFPDMVRIQNKQLPDSQHDLAIAYINTVQKKRKVETAFFACLMDRQRALYSMFGWQLPFLLPADQKTNYQKIYNNYFPIVLHFHPTTPKQKKLQHQEEARELYRQGIIAFYTAFQSKKNK